VCECALRLPDNRVEGMLGLGAVNVNPIFMDTTSTYCISRYKFSSVFSINDLQRSSSMEKLSRGGEKRTAVWAAHPEERGSDEVAAPPICAPRVVPHRWVVLDRYNPAGVAAAARRDAAARGRRSVRAADGGVVDVAQALHGSPSAPPIIAQRVARFDHNHAHNCLPSLKLHREIQ